MVGLCDKQKKKQSDRDINYGVLIFLEDALYVKLIFYQTNYDTCVFIEYNNDRSN